MQNLVQISKEWLKYQSTTHVIYMNGKVHLSKIRFLLLVYHTNNRYRTARANLVKIDKDKKLCYGRETARRACQYRN